MNPARKHNSPQKAGVALATLAVLGLSAAHPAAAQSSLTASSTPVDGSITVNLTNEGQIDWTKYSQSAAGSRITYRKAGAPTTDIMLTGIAGPQTYSDAGNNAPNFTWSDGAAPHQSGSDDTEYFYGTDGGLQTGSFTVQSLSLSGTTNIFNLYTGCYSGGATVTSKLYDDNGVVLQTFTGALAASPQNEYTEYSFDYTGGSYLSTTVTSTNPYGNNFHTVNLQAATLATPEPSSMATFALAGLGLAGMGLKARRRRTA